METSPGHSSTLRPRIGAAHVPGDEPTLEHVSVPAQQYLRGLELRARNFAAGRLKLLGRRVA